MSSEQQLLLVIVSSAIGFIPAVIASGKGHSFVGWWLFGALLFPLALVCAILVGRTEGASHAGMMRCPQCAEWIQDKAVVCRYCRYDLSAVSKSKPPPLR